MGHHPNLRRSSTNLGVTASLLASLLAAELPAPASGQGTSLTAAANDDQAIPSKAARYHTALRRSPQPGLVFERFCDAWLAEASAQSLETYLRQQATGDDPADALIHGFYLAREGRNVEALQVFRATLAAHPGSAAAHYFKAQTEAATLDFDTALADLENAAAAEPGDALAADIGELRGRLLVRVGQREQALEVWNKLLTDRPNDLELYENLVVIQAEEGLFEPAVATLDTLIERTNDPQKKIARQLWRGDLLQQNGQKDDALAAYEAALHQVGSGGWLERQVLAQIEQVYRREQEISAFVKRLDELAKDHPERLELGRRRARLLGELGRTDDAIAQWKSVLERAPGDRELKAAFADVLAEADKTEEAATLVQALRDDRPDDGELRLRLASLYKKLNRDDDAVAEVRGFYDLGNRELTPGIRAIRTLERLTLNSAAEALARELAQARADEPGATETLAELLFRLDKKDEATALWTGLAQDASDATGLLSATRALSSRGLSTPALDALLGRVDDFPNDPELRAAIADAALRDNRPAVAVAHLRPWLSLLSERGGEDSSNIEAVGRAAASAARVARSAKAEPDLIETLAAATPRSDGETWLLASLYEQTFDGAAAEALLTPAPEAQATQSETLVRARVELLRNRGQFTQAADVLNTLIERPGNTRSVLLRELINLYALAARTDDALATVERWKQASPGSVSPWLQQATLLKDAGKQPAALAALQTASRRFPDDVSVSTVLAETYGVMGRTADAARVYWKLYDASESTAAKLPWIGKLTTLTRFTDGGDAVIAQLEARRNQDRNSAEPHLALAEAHRVLDHYEQRRAALMEASRVEPENLDLLLTIARTEQQAGELETATGTLRRALPLDKSGRVRQRLASLYVYLDRLDQASALMQPTDGTPTSADDALAFGDALIGIDAWEEAAAYLTEALTNHPADYRVAYLKAVALSESQDPDNAADAFLALLDLSEELPTVNNAPPDPFAAQFKVMEGLIVPESKPIIEQMSAGYRAFSHRPNNPFHAFQQHQAGASAVVALPNALNDSHVLGIAHLRSLAQESTDEQRDALIAGMVARGVRLAPLLVDLPLQQHGSELLPPDAMETHRDDPAVVGIALLMSGWGQQEIDLDLLAHGEQMFRESHPGLALMAALSRHTQSIDTDDHDPDAWPRIEHMLAQITTPPDMLVAMLGRYTGGLPGQAPTTALPDAQRTVLNDQMHRWYHQLDATSQMRPFILMLSLIHI